MTLRRIILAALLCGLASAAKAEPGRTAAPFLKRTMGAQAAGMGNAFTAMTGRADALQFNPAAAASLEKKTLTSTYLNGFGGTTHGYFGYTHPLPFMALSTSLLYYNAGHIDLNLSDGTTGRVTAEEDTAWSATAAFQPLKGVFVGGTYRHVRLELAETAKASSSQFDFGAIWRLPLDRVPWLGVRAGAAYQYIGPDIVFEQDGDPPPRTMRYGIAVRFPEIDPKKIDPSVDLQGFDMNLTADLVNTLREDSSPRFGAEFGLTPYGMSRVALRLGWVLGRDAESFTFGMGFRHGRFDFDYSFADADALGNLQQLSLTIGF